MDFTVVAPACSSRAAALLLGGIVRQDVVAEVCVIQIIVTLSPLLCRGGERRDGFGVPLSCR